MLSGMTHGLLSCLVKDVINVFVFDGGENVKDFTIDIHLVDMSKRVISSYFPLENAGESKKSAFLEYLSEQAKHASASGKGMILQGDLNSLLGPKSLPGDLRPQGRYG